MATQVQRRRGTTAQHATFTGAVGEITIDTDKKTAVVHDGATAGGNPLALEADLPDMSNVLEVGDIGVTVQGYDVTTLKSAAIGVTVQGYDADTAKTDVAQTFTISQKGTQTTDNDLSFNLAATNFFKCTPGAGGALTFTNIPTGQSGMVLLVNGSNYAITAAATTKVGATTLATISATGTYLLSYYADGTNVYVVNSGALA
jgi:hypothetical protein